LPEAEKVARFWRSLLSYAYQRAGKKSSPAGARWSWLSIENGDDSCGNGRWLDHVLHMGNIALETWTCYRYSNDQSYLEKTGYPVLSGCADFFQIQMIYELKDGRTIIGRCCDLERLPPARENAFLTTCGAIASLQFAADAADVLRVDSQRAASWRQTAAKLKKSLPSDGQRYLPYPGATERSVASLSGIYPYGVIGPSDPLQRAAIYDFEKNAMSAGNMYATGERICSWYAAWLAAAQARIGDGEGAYRNVKSSLDSVGKFGEIFEINEPNVMSVPWCSSPQGTYIQAVNEMLLQCEADTVKIAPALPRQWKAVEFSLKAFDDLSVDVGISGANVERLTVRAGRNYSGRPKTLVLPNGKPVKMELGANGTFSLGLPGAASKGR
jgi:alpha-L-fucosidase 2